MIHNLFSTLPTFKNLGDLKPGLNVLLAQKTEGSTSKQTRNRAGKTSFIEAVHFLTGSEAGPDSIFRTPELAEYTFGMDFDLKDARTVVERSGSAKAKIYVTTPPAAKRKLSATDWVTCLGEEMFGLSSLEAAGSKPPSFRSLFAYFVRRQMSGAFTTPEKQATMQGTGDMQMALMFLLGLDWQQTKTEMVYQYLTGPRFRHRVEAIVEAFSSMQEDLDKERKVIMKQWAKREEQIERVMGATVGMYGDLQGIAGKTLQEIEGLSWEALPGPNEET